MVDSQQPINNDDNSTSSAEAVARSAVNGANAIRRSAKNSFAGEPGSIFWLVEFLFKRALEFFQALNVQVGIMSRNLQRNDDDDLDNNNSR